MKKSFVLFMAATSLTGCSGWPNGHAPHSEANNGQFDQAPSFYQSPYDHDRQAFVEGQSSDQSQMTENNEALYYADKAWNADNIRDRDTNFSKYLLAKQRQPN